MNRPSINIDAIVCKGGLDQITPTLTLANTFARFSLNFEAAVTGGYSRIVGYERFDGRPSPADSASGHLYQIIEVSESELIPAIGSALTFTGGATATVAYATGEFFSGPAFYNCMYVLTDVTGTILLGDAVDASSQYAGVVGALQGSVTTPEEDSLVKNAVADQFRADIAAVPGSGPVRGVFEFNDVVYAFRDNAGADALVLYKSTAGGWVAVPFYYSVPFTDGGTDTPADGDTLTQGVETALIKRVVLEGGEWQAGDAFGRLIIEAGSGILFAAAATAGTADVTLADTQVQISMLPGGRFEFEEHNFYGQEPTTRIYGCDGVNKAFEFDGDILVPISTGATTDTPTHVVAHKGFLFLSIGSSAMHSAPGLPYNFTALSGAGELATGSAITEMLSMPGGTSTATLGLFNRNNTSILYGTGPTDWNLVTYNTGTGAVPFSAQNMSQSFVFDDRGVNSVQTALQYGNFTQSTLTNTILPFITSKINLMTASTLCRRKSQYRIFFSDGYGVFITVVNGKLLGCMPVYFPNPVRCCYEGKNSSGADVIYFGSTNGMVYQMEKGTSFDGDPIDFNLTMNYSNAKSPRTLKRYRKAVPELAADFGSFVKFRFGHILGYDSSAYSQPGFYSYDRYVGSSRWDSFIWDNFFWDTNDTDFVEVGIDGTAENIAIAINGSYDYVPAFTINSFLVHYSPRRMMR